MMVSNQKICFPPSLAAPFLSFPLLAHMQENRYNNIVIIITMLIALISIKIK